MADIIENPKEAVELSQEELAAKRDEITKYYTDHIPHLEKQLEYENLLKDIEKTRAERMQAQAFMTKMAATPPAPENNSNIGQNLPPRQTPSQPNFTAAQMKEFNEAKAKRTAEAKKDVEEAKAKRTLKKTKKND